MKTRAAALSSDAVCNLTVGSASLPFTEPGLFRKSCDLVWRRACQFQQPLKLLFFIRESQLLNRRERIKTQRPFWHRRHKRFSIRSEGSLEWFCISSLLSCCCCFSSSRPWLYSIFYLFFIIKQGRDGIDPRCCHLCEAFEFQLTFFHQAEASAVDACVN